MSRNRDLALRAREILCEALRVEPPCPETMIGALASVPLPKAAAGAPAERLGPEALAAWFRERNVETWFCPWPSAGGKLVRASAQIYNCEEQYRHLAALLVEALRGE
jgi:isopenicillin-N epimerase